MSNIGLIDVDGHNFPNIPLMKLSAYHKQLGDAVEMYDFTKHYDRVYMSKVFSFTPDYEHPPDTDEIIRGGSGYAISLVGNREAFDSAKDTSLSYEIEHQYPDYGLYPELTKDTAYGFLTRGCPRGCAFCHVGAKEGKCSYVVADVHEFWNGQKNICLCDPNILASPSREELLLTLADTGAKINFNQGLDARLLTPEVIDILRRVKIHTIHFAWDNYTDSVCPENIRMFKEQTGINGRNISVFVLTNFDTTFEQDLERIMKLREIEVRPYVMIYNKQSVQKGTPLRKLQRWVNNQWLWRTSDTFEEYLKGAKK